MNHYWPCSILFSHCSTWFPHCFTVIHCAPRWISPQFWLGVVERYGSSASSQRSAPPNHGPHRKLDMGMQLSRPVTIWIVIFWLVNRSWLFLGLDSCIPCSVVNYVTMHFVGELHPLWRSSLSTRPAGSPPLIDSLFRISSAEDRAKRESNRPGLLVTMILKHLPLLTMIDYPQPSSSINNHHPQVSWSSINHPPRFTTSFSNGWTRSWLTDPRICPVSSH